MAVGALLLLLCVSKIAIAGFEVVNYATPDAFRVLASYYRPGTASTRAIVILPDPKEGRAAWAAVAESLSAAGFHVLVPDLRGTAASAMQRGVRRERARFTRSEVANAGLDAEAAVRYLRDLPDMGIRAVALIGSGIGVMTVPGARKVSLDRSSRILISPSVDEDAGAWAEAIRGETDDLLVVVTSHDLDGIDVAATLIPKGGSRECWMIEGTERGPELLRTRSDLVRPLIAWIERSLSSP